MKELPYFEMRAEFFPREQNQTVTFKLKDLENIWFCTAKNVKRKLKSFESEGLLQYIPGIGRGNASTLQFTKPFKAEIEETVTRLVEQDQLEQVIQLLQLPIPKDWIANVSSEVQQLFGLKSPTKAKDILRTVTKRKMTTLHPMYSSVTLESHLIKQLSDTLVRYDQATDEMKPHLAHHWKHNEDFTLWTFHLRKGVLFHNHQSLTSEDVKATIERYQEQMTPNDWLVEDIKAVECPAPFTVQFQLTKSNPFFLHYISSFSLAILPKDVVFDEKIWIGTGPFKLAEHTESKIVLEAFDYYFLERPFLDQVEVWQVPVDAFEEVSYGVERYEMKDSPQLMKEVETGFRFLAFNFNKELNSLVRNKFFREAIYHLLDTRKMYKELDREDFLEASSFFPWKSSEQNRDPKLIPDLLKKSNYEGEKITLFSLGFPKAMEEASWFIQRAEKYGIQIDLRTFQLKDLYSNRLEKEADLTFLGEISSLNHHLSFLGAFFNRALLFRKFLSEEQLSFIYKQLEEIKRQQSAKEREVYVSKVEDFLREQYLIIFQHHPIHTVTFHPMIKDIQPDAFNKVDFSKIWIE